MEKLPKKNSSQGQALLIILLIMAVALTIGLATISRSVTDVKISQQTEEAARAFSAAEAGIEEALMTKIGGSGSFAETGAAYQTVVSAYGSGPEYVTVDPVSLDNVQTVYLAEYQSNGTLVASYNQSSIDVCGENNAALAIGIYYQQAGVYKVAKATVDPDTHGRILLNNFDVPDSGSCGGLTYKKTIALPTSVTLLFLRIRVLYSPSRIGVAGVGSGLLPSQGLRFDSTGTSGQSVRKVEVIRTHPAPPAIFDFGLYSGADIVK